MSGLRTIETGSGSSGDYIHTPTTKDNLDAPSMQKWAGNWAGLSPTATEYGSNQGGAAGRTGRVRPSLSSMLATPLASTAGSHDSHRGGSRATAQGRRGADLGSQLAAMMPTPLASHADGSRGQMGTRNGKPRRKNDLAAMMPPTPTVRDTRSDMASPETMDRNSRPLSETAGELGLTGTAASPVWQRRALLLGLVLWLMGAPEGWFQGCETPSSAPRATRSSHRSPKR